MELEELGVRVVSALFEENSGNQHHRRLVISGRAFDALIWSGTGEECR